MEAAEDSWRGIQEGSRSAQPKYRRVAEAFPAFNSARRHGNNLAQLKAQSPQTPTGAAKSRDATEMIDQIRNPSHKVIDEIESRQQNTDSLKVELERVGDIKANSTRSITVNNVLEIREPEPLSREEEGQSSPISEGAVTENPGRQDLRTEELLRKALRMDGRSTPAWMKARHNLIAQGRLQSRASYGSRHWSRNPARGNGTQMRSTGTTSEALAFVKNR